MKQNNYNKTSSLIFLLIALTHGWIVLSQSIIAINGEELGIWVSGLGFVVTAYMALSGYKMKVK